MQDSDDRFRPAVRPPRSNRTSDQRFVNQLLRQSGGSLKTRANKSKRSARLGRGHVAANIAGRGLTGNARRVVIKMRLVRLDAAGSKSGARHLRYIERDGTGRDGEAGRAFGPVADAVDLDDFRERCAEDRHQFRLIVAPEDGDQLGDLRSYTRALMRRMERDLGTELEWLAVEHWDTDNPHIHLVLRGRDDQGQDLVIARDYIAKGMRQRACELATEWLGPRTDREIAQSSRHDIGQPRWTQLDRALQAQLRDGEVDLRDLPADTRLLLRGRLQHLVTMELAKPIGRDTWSLYPDFDTTLRAMGERGDIIRTMQRALTGRDREFAIFDASRQASQVIGRIAASGLADELHDRGYLIVDGLDGRAHYVALAAGSDIADYPRGGIVEVRPTSARDIDKSIGANAHGGIYRRDVVIAELRAQGAANPEAAVQAQVRRLEALRRARLVERISDGTWQIPPDLAVRGQAYDARRLDGAQTILHTPLGLDQQQRAVGSTWLDQQLVARRLPEGEKGFAPEVRDALKVRADFLIEQGLAERRGQRIVLGRDLLATLRQRELRTFAEREAAALGKPYQPASDGQTVTGTYRRSVQLVSGRMAVLDTESGFSLVPWRAVIDKQLGRSISATVTGSRVSFAWNRGHEHSR